MHDWGDCDSDHRTSATSAEGHTILMQDAKPCVGQIHMTWVVYWSNKGIYWAEVKTDWDIFRRPWAHPCGHLFAAKLSYTTPTASVHHQRENNELLRQEGTVTTGNSRFAERPTLCRVPGTGTRQRLAFAECHVRHSIKTFFAECFLAVGKEPSLPSVFFECFSFGTWQRSSFPSARKKTLGKPLDTR